jgi:hypothetical protein
MRATRSMSLGKVAVGSHQIVTVTIKQPFPQILQGVISELSDIVGKIAKHEPERYRNWKMSVHAYANTLKPGSEACRGADIGWIQTLLRMTKHGWSHCACPK